MVTSQAGSLWQPVSLQFRSLCSPGQHDWWPPRSNHWHSDTQLFQHLIWRLLYVHCQMLDSGELGKRPQLVRKFSQWLRRRLGTVSVISCSVICTIRTAFLPQAFDKQLQKTNSSHSSRSHSSRKKRKKKKRKKEDRQKYQTRQMPLLHPARTMHILLWKWFHARPQRVNLIKKNSS